ncbi:MAG TPA: c-type cytochrome [Pyrinomonadaceae bacterium]|jgi:cytochrome c|nr:c-type cytochrome [Pyrinomonadaceae bacterium]
MRAPWLIVPALGLFIVVSQALPQSAQPAPAEFAKNRGCFECHSVDKKVTGPAYKDVANRYKNDENARAALIETVKNGGKGHWTEVTGGVPMPPFSPRLTDAEITRLVDWILSLKDNQ